MSLAEPVIRERLFYLRPQFRSRRGMSGGYLGFAPWVDVILLFLLFLIVQTATVKKPGLLVNLPTARTAAGARYDAQVLTVPREGVYFFADERVNEVILADRLRKAAAASPVSELIIEADGSISYQALTALYNVAVEAGWKNIVLATRTDPVIRSAP